MMEVLLKIAQALGGAGTPWALGASLMLKLYGLPVTPQDIDLMVQPDDAAKAAEVLCTLGEKKPQNPHVRYATQAFMEFVIDGIEVDVMAGFVIRQPDGDYTYVLNPSDFAFVPVQGVQIPLCPLADWLHLYRLMERAEKVNLIEEHLQAHGF